MTEIRMEDVYVIIPAYNEEKHIKKVIEQTYQGGYHNIVVVSDGGKDNTVKVAQETKATVLEHIINLGKGCALITGADYAVKQGAKILVFIDADGQHKPEDIKRLLEKMKGADIVYGSRKIDDKMPIVMRFGNWVINTVTLILYGIKLKDTQSGFRSMTTTAYKKIKWNSNDYRVESEMITKAAKQKLKYNEIEIETIYEDDFKGTTVFDGIKIVLNLLKWRII